jgi:ABC-type Fe3+-hydroxamate transport system substrate-binding protein
VTETLLSWGVRPVGVTRFCEAPGVPLVGGTKNPDIAAIVALSPSVVAMDQEENRREDAEALAAAGIRVVASDVRSIDDVASSLDRLAVATGVILQGPAADVGPAYPVHHHVFVPIWRRPWMTIGRDTYGSSILGRAGFRNVWGDSSDPYPEVRLETVVELKPDIVLAPSEPYRFSERHRAELEEVAPVVFVDGQDLFWWGSRTSAALNRLRELAAALSER